jgi:membrane associated rhomboid family serine protease
MPFSERPYVAGYSNWFPPGVRWLLIANVACFVVQFFLEHSDLANVTRPFYLFPAQVVGGLAFWQLFTYMFLHSTGDFWHILFNMLTLWMFGNDLERTWGTRQFLNYYLLCGVGAGICVIVANYLFGNPYIPTIGASGAIYGLLLAFGLLYPNRQILFSFLFPIQAKYFVLILGAIAFMSSFAAPGGAVSHIAHLGGMIFGYLYLRNRRGTQRSYAGFGGGFAPSRDSSVRRRRTSLVASARNWYKEWKLQRARRKFEVYLRKQNRDRDPRVH